MKPLRLLFALALFGLFAQPAAAQELDCSVRVDYRALTGSDYSFLDELEVKIEEYMNQRNWTNDRFLEFERIDCQMTVTFEEAISLTSFRARLIIASRRPIYGTTQNTAVVQFNDPDWRFNFAQGTPLVFDLDRYDALTSVLDYYAYVMLGYDYDTFAEFGGTTHFEKARLVSDVAQSTGAQGWSQLGGDRSRSQLISQILDPRFRPLRKAYFDYHFYGLDRFVAEPGVARANVLETLGALNQLYEETARSYVLDLFFNAKYQELPGVFEQSPMTNEVYELLAQLDPAHLSEYNSLVE